MKKPTLPEYEKLPWVVNVRLDMFITKKLRSRTSLNSDESARLKSTLAEAAKNLKKLHGPETKTQINGLENYIQSL